MNRKKFHSIEYTKYIQKGDQRQEVVLGKDKNNLSKLTMDILDLIFKKRIVIIFSQGPLNITPLVSCMYSYISKRDVIIGIPQKNFKQQYQKDTKTYFSMLFTRKPRGYSLFFYKDLIWGSGEVDFETNALKKLKIKTCPSHGTGNFKKEYSDSMTNRLKFGELESTPKIMSIPLSNYLPAGIIGENPIYFQKSEYTLKNFDPTLFILESINEGHFNFDHIIYLIQKIKEKDKKLILHFSWPYLRGVKNFLDLVKEDKEVAIFHLGKRFCLELEDRFEKPPPYGLELSLEGELWDITYYPSTKSQFNYEIWIPSIQTSSFSIDEIKNYDWELDNSLKSIRYYAGNDNQIDDFDRNLLKFPPVIDTFLLPREIKKIGSINGTSRYLPLKDYFSNKYPENKTLQAFNGLIFQIDSSRNLAYDIRGLKTNTAFNKRTLFQAYLIQKIQLLGLESPNLKREEMDESIIIANLHPYLHLGTRRSLNHSLDYLIESISLLIEKAGLPTVNIIDSTVNLRIDDENHTMVEDGVFKQLNINRIQRKLADKFSNTPLVVSVSHDTKIMIKISLDLSSRRIRFTQGLTNGINDEFESLDLYSLIISEDKCYYECSLSGISSTKKDYGTINFDLNVVWTINNSGDINSVKNTITFSYLELPKIILSKSIWELKNCELLIPGPIPFHTFTEDEIRISQGFDALLLPFKRIIFFAYPGENFKRLSNQIESYIDLFKKSSRLAKQDLEFSLKYLTESKVKEYPIKLTQFDVAPPEELSDDSPIDTLFRDEFLKRPHENETEQKILIELADIWKNIKETKISQKGTQKRLFDEDKELIKLDVLFKSGKREWISFTSGRFIRRKENDNYISCRVDDLVVGNEIIYLQTNDRENIDDYFLHDFIEEDISLEYILRPFSHLKLFYEALKLIECSSSYDSTTLQKLDWLKNEKRRKLLFELFKKLFDESSISEVSEMFCPENIWTNVVSPERLVDIFKNKKRMSYALLYKIAKSIGPIEIKESTFKQYCSMALGSEKNHYYFRTEEDLLTLGKLLGDYKIIENYMDINENGKQIKNVFQTIGNSVSRVTKGKADPLNVMDSIIMEKMRRCTILDIKLPW